MSASPKDRVAELAEIFMAGIAGATIALIIILMAGFIARLV